MENDLALGWHILLEADTLPYMSGFHDKKQQN